MPHSGFQTFLRELNQKLVKNDFLIPAALQVPAKPSPGSEVFPNKKATGRMPVLPSKSTFPGENENPENCDPANLSRLLATRAEFRPDILSQHPHARQKESRQEILPIKRKNRIVSLSRNSTVQHRVVIDAASTRLAHPMKARQIKNIFWDVDGVLADLNHAYFHFLTGHPKYRDRYAGLKWEELPEVLPIVPEYGALELKTHPELGAEMDRDFCADQDFFRNRPLYPKVIETLQRLNARGYRQFTMSATFDVAAKTAYLNEILAPVTGFLTIECVRHGEFMHDTAKVDRLRESYLKYGLKPDETILVDDRIYNQHAAIESGAHPVRLRCEFTTDLPADLAWIPEFKNVEAVAGWLLGEE